MLFRSIAAAILTILHRFTTAGQRPLFLVTSSTRGTGKSRLANLIGTIATGIEPHGDSPTDDPDEEKKRMLAYALAGKHVLCFDNIADSLGNAALDAILTQSSISGRVLGATRVVEGDNKFVLFATGNNPAIAEDTRRRTVEIRIDSGEERPENRNFTRSWSELEAFVAKNRPALLTAAFTLIRGAAASQFPGLGLLGLLSLRSPLTLGPLIAHLGGIVGAFGWVSGRVGGRIPFGGRIFVLLRFPGLLPLRVRVSFRGGRFPLGIARTGLGFLLGLARATIGIGRLTPGIACTVVRAGFRCFVALLFRTPGLVCRGAFRRGAVRRGAVRRGVGGRGRVLARSGLGRGFRGTAGFGLRSLRLFRRGILGVG